MRGMRYQPQGRLRLNRRNPLTKGLIFFALMAGGNDLVNLVDGTRASAASLPGTMGNSQGRFASFTGAHNIDFPGLSLPLNSNQPASIGWIQQPIGASGYHALLQLKARDAAAPFLIYQSPSDANYYFAAGIRSTSVSAFGASTGPLTNGKIDTFVLTAANGIGGNATTGLNLFRGAQKFAPSGSPFLSSSSASAFSIGHRDGGADPWRGLIGCVAVWDRVLTDVEAASFNANPWQLIAARDAYETTALAAPVDRTLVVTSAALLLDGSGAGIRVSRQIGVQPVALAVAGANVAMRAVRRASIQPCVLTLAGGKLGLVAAHRVAVAPADLSLQPGAAQLRAIRRLTVEPVEITVSGGALQFKYTPAAEAGGYVMVISPSALLISGGNVGMRITRRLKIDSARFALAGHAIAFRDSATGTPIDATAVPSARTVVFAGGRRAVIFNGGIRVVDFAGGIRTVRF